ncbi:MAG: hypothetical protein WAU59_00360, partial [Rhodoplanes sp.]
MSGLDPFGERLDDVTRRQSWSDFTEGAEREGGGKARAFFDTEVLQSCVDDPGDHRVAGADSALDRHPRGYRVNGSVGRYENSALAAHGNDDPLNPALAEGACRRDNRRLVIERMAEQFGELVNIRLDHIGGDLDGSGERLAAGIEDDPAAARRESLCDVAINGGRDARRQAAGEDEHLRARRGQRIDRCEHFVDLLGSDGDAGKVDVSYLVACVVNDLDVDAGMARDADKAVDQFFFCEQAEKQFLIIGAE